MLKKCLLDRQGQLLKEKEQWMKSREELLKRKIVSLINYAAQLKQEQLLMSMLFYLLSFFLLYITREIWLVLHSLSCASLLD